MCRHYLEQILTLTTTYWLQRSALDLKTHKVPKGRAKMGYGELQGTLEQKLSAAECQSENVEVQ
jgi:lysozyme family protein